jgi:hypothetical protein
LLSDKKIRYEITFFCKKRKNVKNVSTLSILYIRQHQIRNLKKKENLKVQPLLYPKKKKVSEWCLIGRKSEKHEELSEEEGYLLGYSVNK